MNIQQMRYVIEVEKTGSISRAAGNLFMGQPNLSKAIKELESSLGIRIFERTPKGVIATDSGGKFLREIRGVVEQIESIETRYCQTTANIQSLSVSVPHCWYFSSAFSRFARELDTSEEMELEFNETDSVTAINNVLQGKQHIGFIRYHMDCEPFFMQMLAEQNLKHRVMREFDNKILISKTHPLSCAESITEKELADYIELSNGGCSVSKTQSTQCSAAINPAKHKVCVREFSNQLVFLANETRSYMWAPTLPGELLEQKGLVQKACSTLNRRSRDLFISVHGHVSGKLEKLFLEKLHEQIDVKSVYA